MFVCRVEVFVNGIRRDLGGIDNFGYLPRVGFLRFEVWCFVLLSFGSGILRLRVLDFAILVVYV